MKKVNFVCPICGVHHMKDAGNLLDYANTEWGVVLLQSFCPECGRMEPLLMGYRLNKKILRNYAIKIAMRFGLDFDKCKKVANNTPRDANFVEYFSKQLKLTQYEVEKAIRWHGHKRHKLPMGIRR